MKKTLVDQMYLHLLVLLLAFSGIAGKLITLDAEILVWWRMLIALLGLSIYIFVKGIEFKLPGRSVTQLVLNGFITAAHWVCFFMAIKVSNVSVALICFSSTTFFMAFLEPLFLKRKLILYEVFLGLVVIGGLYFIFNLEVQYKLGIVLGVLAAFLGCLFAVINARFVKKYDAAVITSYEMLGGVLVLSAYFFLFGNVDLAMFMPTSADVAYLMFLGLVCTSFAFVAMVELMKVVTPFSIAISLNLEPIYAILLALMFFGSSEYMKPGFYIGSLVIVSSILFNGYLKNRSKNAITKSMERHSS
ncbi:MAG: DMT family transporter [Flavobacteriales bacterium]|nr:DMT family transporter [Flavobacteriales bacterium]